MDYSELSAPAELRHAVKLAWTLDVSGQASENVRHVATPDGCMEIIRRLRGRSSWNGEQPEHFVAGIITRPAELQLGGGSRFVGVRLRPWAWNLIARVWAPLLIDRWAALADAAPQVTLPDSAAEALEAVGALVSLTRHPLFDALLSSRSVAEMAARSGRSHCSLQRWFEREVGLAPRTYLRLLRFSDTLGDLARSNGTLAAHAAEHGFADQAHMSREFRSMAGASARAARSSAVGPFLPDAPEQLPS